MQVVLAKSNFERIGLIENASVIWNDRFYESGEYELYMPITQEHLELLSQSLYVIRDDNTNNIGVIQDVTLTHDSDNGDNIKVTGKFASGYYLSKRVVNSQTIIYNTIPNTIRGLVDQNLINPSEKSRKIDKIVLGARPDTFTTNVSMQVTGDNVYDKVVEICKAYEIGLKMPLKNNKLYLDLYQGTNRSYAQYDNPFVVFSDDYDNLDNVEYTKTTSEVINFAYVAGEGEGSARKIVTAFNGNEPTGEERNEIWVDQRNMSSNDGEITNEELTEQMRLQGLEELKTFTENFSGDLLDTLGYEYNKDFFLGDIVTVQMKRWQGLYANVRIIEVTESEDENGKVLSFTFEI